MGIALRCLNVFGKLEFDPKRTFKVQCRTGCSLQHKIFVWRRPGQVKPDWFGASWGTACFASRCEHAFNRSKSVAVLGRSRCGRLLAAGGYVALASAEGGGVGNGDLAVAVSTTGQVPNLQPVLFYWTEPQ